MQRGKVTKSKTEKQKELEEKKKAMDEAIAKSKEKEKERLANERFYIMYGDTKETAVRFEVDGVSEFNRDDVQKYKEQVTANYVSMFKVQ